MSQTTQERPFTEDDTRLMLTALDLAVLHLKCDALEMGSSDPDFEVRLQLAAKITRLRVKIERRWPR